MTTYPLTRYFNSVRFINLAIILMIITIWVIHGGLIYRLYEGSEALKLIAGIAGGFAVALGVFATSVNKELMNSATPIILAILDGIGVIIFLGMWDGDPDLSTFKSGLLSLKHESVYEGMVYSIIIYAFSYIFQKKSRDELKLNSIELETAAAEQKRKVAQQRQAEAEQAATKAEEVNAQSIHVYAHQFRSIVQMGVCPACGNGLKGDDKFKALAGHSRACKEKDLLVVLREWDKKAQV